MPLERLIASSPHEVGVDPAKLQAVFDRAEQEVTAHPTGPIRAHRASPFHPAPPACMQVVEGRLVGCQVAVARHGRLAGMATFGSTADGAPATNDTLFACFSSTKATMAVAMWQLLEEGKWALDDPVTKFVPEFGTLGKERVRMRHLVTFTGGFPNPPTDLTDTELMGSSAARTEQFATWPLEFEPGSKWV